MTSRVNYKVEARGQLMSLYKYNCNGYDCRIIMCRIIMCRIIMSDILQDNNHIVKAVIFLKNLGKFKIGLIFTMQLEARSLKEILVLVTYKVE